LEIPRRSAAPVKDPTPHHAGAQADPLYGSEYLYEIYRRAKPDYTGQITAPVLWDKQRETIVNNESADIIRMLNNSVGEMADNHIDLYPESLRTEINAVKARLYDRFNNGVYRAGLAITHAHQNHERSL
jgi:putative glutathione S-transferase